MRTVPNVADCAKASLPGAPAGLLAWLRRAIRLPMRRRGLLDPRSLSDHLKRDIGALDGNDPRGPRP